MWVSYTKVGQQKCHKLAPLFMELPINYLDHCIQFKRTLRALYLHCEG